MEKKRTGYRTEQLYGEGFRDPVKVLAFETYELENKENLIEIAEHLFKNTATENELNEAYMNYDSDDKGLEDFEKLYAKAMQEYNQTHDRAINYCLWLCDSKQDLIDAYYSDGIDTINEEDIDEYDITEGVVMIELGKEGKLYGFEKEPEIIR